MSNRKKLATYLKSKECILNDDPLHHTKQFLKMKRIPVHKFFRWIVDEAGQYGYSINNDKGVRVFLQ